MRAFDSRRFRFAALIPIAAAIIYASGTLAAQDFDGIVQEMQNQASYWTAERQREACMGAYRAAMMADARNQTILEGQRRDAIARQVRAFDSGSQAAMDNHNYLGAIYDCQQALALDPGNALMKGRLALAMNGQGLALFAERDFAGAADYFQQALLSSPNDPVIQQNLLNAESEIRLLALEAARRQADITAATDMRKIVSQNSAHFWFVPADDNDWGTNSDTAPLDWDSNVVDLRDARTDIVSIGQAQGVNPSIPLRTADLVTAPLISAPARPAFIPPADKQACQAMLADLDRQIRATRMQLASLGFNARSDDFEQIGQLAAQQRDELFKRLDDQLRDIAVDCAADRVQEKMLDAVGGINEEDMESMLKTMRENGISTDALQDSLTAALGQTDQRVKLAAEAQVLVGAVQTLADVKESEDDYNQHTIEGRQQALLTAVSIFDEAKPAVEVARAAYAVGDAGRCLMILSAGAHQLDITTSRQLADLNVITSRMKSLVDHRSMVRDAMRAMR